MRFFSLFLFIFCAALFFTHSPAHAESIVAVVNQDAISTSDLNDRMQMIMASSGLADSPDIRAKLTPQILNALIEEQLKFQEAQRLNIKVTEEDVNRGFGDVAAQNNIPLQKFKDMLEHSGINLNTMNRQIKAQIGWGKVIQQSMRPQVSVTDGDIDDYIQRMKANKGKTEYLIAEILLPIDDKNPDAQVKKLAIGLTNEIKKGAPFMKVAQQFSSAPGAANGGDRGWIQEGTLDPELDAAIRVLQKGTISDPVRTQTGYHIFLLRDVRMITDESIPPRDKILSLIGIQRLERMQERRLLDLKSSAFIDTRT